MFKNNFKSALRNFWNNKFYTAINISGLAVGLATAIMLLLWVQNEFSFDKFNTNYKNIYQLSSHFNSGGEERVWKGVPGPLAILSGKVPAVQSIVRTENGFNQVIANKDKTKILSGIDMVSADSGFFKMFSYPLLEGNKSKVLRNSNSVVLTESLAHRLFGNENAMGKTIVFYQHFFTVDGVMKDFPANSSLQYDAVFPMSFFGQIFTESGGNGDWKTIDEDMGDFSFTTYVQLAPHADPAKVGKTLSALYKDARNGDSDASFQLENLGDIHLVTPEGNMAALRMVQIFLLVVVLLLLIASINYVNLSTARSLTRAKEVSIRKIIGAGRKELFLQFITETLVLFVFSLIVAVLLIDLLMPLYNNISGKQLSFSVYDIKVWEVIGLAVAGTLIASGIYPAIMLSSFKPIQAMKGKITSGVGIHVFRKVLVVFQFAISVILIVCTITMSNQMHYIRNKSLGFDKSYVFTVPLRNEISQHADAIKEELKKQPGILDVALTDANNFTNISSATGDLSWPAKSTDVNLMITQVSADKDLIPLMKIKLLEGSNFTGTPSDSNKYIINETAAHAMGLKEPYAGQQISLHDKKGVIAGVVKDFNFQSLKEKISPFIFFTFWNNRNILYVRTTAADAQAAIAATKKQYKKYSTDNAFDYHFLDQEFEKQYLSDQRAGLLFNVFAGIAIFISCLGLFGLVTSATQAKVKEIGIRKVLGASVTGIVEFISKDFLKLVLLGIIIAVPVAWWAMNKWLQGFAYRENMSWWIFGLAGFIALAIAMLTISFKAIKAAMANPVKSLRTE
jgi:ABC-type antimicrobial peptide transport system permease subunit